VRELCWIEISSKLVTIHIAGHNLFTDMILVDGYCEIKDRAGCERV